MSKQTVDHKVDPIIVIIDKPHNGYQQARVIVDRVRCVDVINLDKSDADDLSEMGSWVVDAVRNPTHFEDYVLQRIMQSPTGAVSPKTLYRSMIEVFDTPGQARHQAQLYFDRLEEPSEDDDVLKGGIDRAVAWWYMTGWVIQLTKTPDLIQQTKVGKVLREVAFGSDPIVEIAIPTRG